MNPLLRYLKGWKDGDVDTVLSVLADACVVVEIQGTVLRGPAAVADRLAAWNAAGGAVHEWRIVDETESEGVLTAQWVVDLTWQGVQAEVMGRTVAHTRNGAITYLREYATGPLGDWDGNWRE